MILPFTFLVPRMDCWAIVDRKQNDYIGTKDAKPDKGNTYRR